MSEDKNIADSFEAIQYSVKGDNGAIALASINMYFDVMVEQIGEAFNANPEQLELIKNVLAKPREALCEVSTNAIEYTEVFNHHVVENRRLDSPVLFLLNNKAAAIMNNAFMFNRRDISRRPEHGDSDPRWKYEALPLALLYDDSKEPGEVSIPIKADTGHETVFGYLELFVNRVKSKDGQLIKMITEIPAIRVKDNYVVPNSIYRWFEVTKTDVEQDWKKSNGVHPHPKPKPLSKENES